MEEIEIVNFQGHADTLVKLAPEGITAITGASDKGKSSIIRSVKFVRDNKPSGTKFIRKKSKGGCKVRIDNVTHTRTNKENAYYIKGTEDALTSLRQGVPDKVYEELRLGPDNIQSQHDDLFLIDGMTGGAVAAKISELADLSLSQDALRVAGKRKRKAKARLEVISENILELEDELKGLDGLPSFKKRFDAIESKSAQIESLTKKYNNLSSIVESARDSQREFEKAEDPTELINRTKLVIKHQQELAELKAKTKVLSTLIKRIHDNDVCDLDVTTLICKTEKLVQERRQLESLAAFIKELNRRKKRVAKLAKNVEKYRRVHKKELKGACPLCGSDLKGVRWQEINTP